MPSSDEEKKKKRLKAWRDKNKKKISVDSKEYYEKNKKRLGELRKERYKKNKKEVCEKSAEHYFQRTYGVSRQQILDMSLAQKGKCYICHYKPKGGRDCLHLDHNHYTGKIRKLLCVNCNLGMGHFKDDPELLEMAIAYLKEHGGKK